MAAILLCCVGEWNCVCREQCVLLCQDVEGVVQTVVVFVVNVLLYLALQTLRLT